MSTEQEIFTVEIPISGTLAVGVGLLEYPMSTNAQLISATATVGTAPTGAAAIFTVKKNGTALTPNSTLTVPVSANVSNSLSVAAYTDKTATVLGNLTQGASALGTYTFYDRTQVPVTTAVPGDLFTVDVTQVGSTVAGANAVISLMFIKQ